MRKGMIGALGMALVLALAGGPALAEGDAKAGEKLFSKKCKMCHAVKAGKHRIGPSLFGVVGRKAGSTDFKKYKALKDSDIVWDEANLHGWLENPKKFAGKSTSMSAKIGKEKDRDDLIEYLKTLD